MNKLCNKTISIVLEEVTAWIQTHIERIHTVQDVADQFECSTRTLERIFEGYGQVTVSEYIKQCTFERIQVFLQSTDLPCCKIVARSTPGPYESVERAFKRRFGMTMKRYREKQTTRPK